MSTEKIIFRAMQEEESTAIAEMMKALYRSLEAPDDYMTDEKIAATFKAFRLGHIKIEVFEQNKFIVGYALLFEFWYNEYGGMVLNIDELYVKPDFQGQGISSLYLSELNKKRENYVALSMEVLPQNKKAYSLYKKLGYEEKETITLHKLLE